jgi:hypothetical protein
VAKKKVRSPRRPASAAEAHQRRQERLEARREARAEALAAQARAARRERFLRVAVIGVLAGAFVWFFLLQSRPQGPGSIDGHPIERFSESGVGEHVSGTVDYDSAPPTHGPHGLAVACGVYAEPIPNENQVHNLEHGAVGIQYRPDLDPRDIAKIENIVRKSGSRTFSAPYPDMDSAIAVTSWGEMMRLDTFDAAAINDYIEAFRGKGPEGVPCDNTSDDSFRPPDGGGEGGSPGGG